MRFVPQGANYSGSSSLLETEFCGIDLPTALEVHSDAAPTVTGQNAIDRLGVCYGCPVDLHDHVPNLQPDLLLDALADPIHQSALTTLNLVLRADRRRQRDELDLPQ